jgi:hypothetical protein
MKNRDIKGLTQRRQDAKRIRQRQAPCLFFACCAGFFAPIFFKSGCICHRFFIQERERIEKDDTPWEITADSLSYDDKEGTYHAEKNVVIKKARQALYTQSAVFNTKTGIAR